MLCNNILILSSQDLKDLLQTPLTKNNSESILTKLSNISKSPGLTDNDLNVSLTIFENIVQNSDLISSKNKTETERFGQVYKRLRPFQFRLCLYR